MSKLRKLPNIGSVVEEKLKQVGIDSPEKLKELGSKEAFKRLRTIDSSACINMLCALEGAVQGVRWHYLSDEKKKNLKEFFESLK